jgi:hypothetical protein
MLPLFTNHHRLFIHVPKNKNQFEKLTLTDLLELSKSTGSLSYYGNVKKHKRTGTKAAAASF